MFESEIAPQAGFFSDRVGVRGQEQNLQDRRLLP